MNRFDLSREEELWRTETMPAAAGRRRMKKFQDWRDSKERRWFIWCNSSWIMQRDIFVQNGGTERSNSPFYPFNHQVDEVAKMEEENKRIRDEIDSMERRLLYLFHFLSPVTMIIFRYDRIAEFARSHGLDVAVEPHQVKLPACLTLSQWHFQVG